jgi:DNA end-binding protein Ku
MSRRRQVTTKRYRHQGSKRNRSQNPFHAFWSGSVSFGLVNVPVLLFPANRHSGVRLRLMSPQGSLLERRYYCPADGREVEPDEIVRGYQLDDGSYVTVEDRELEALEPKKSHEIELRQFVDLTDLPPTLLERGYYLTPLKEATKAYRLLADVMERKGQAGIATFVMRDREYLVAIFARGGILCAETLRFQDEIREPRSISLPEPVPPAKGLVAAFKRSIDALFARELPKDELVDKSTRTLMEIIQKKLKQGRELVRTTRQADDEEEGESEEPADLLETIRRSLHQTNGRPKKRTTTAKPSRDGKHEERRPTHRSTRKKAMSSRTK